MKHLIILILLYHALLPGNAEEIQTIKPIVSINMESDDTSQQFFTLIEKDSAIEGIDGGQVICTLYTR